MIATRCDSRRIRCAVRPAIWAALRLIAVLAVVGALLPHPLLSAEEELKQSGTLTIEQVQMAFIGSGNLGGGTLSFNGKTYRFSVGGLGIGGFGISKITATGTVYNLTDPQLFPGAYVQARYGGAVGTASMGGLWLKNSNGVVLKLEAQRQGLALSLGGDAVFINFD